MTTADNIFLFRFVLFLSNFIIMYLLAFFFVDKVPSKTIDPVIIFIKRKKVFQYLKSTDKDFNFGQK